MDHGDESRRRKARLRYHQPPSADHPATSSTPSASSASSSSCGYYPHSQSHPQLPRLQHSQYHHQHLQPVRMPAQVVQSASTSPYEMHVNFTSRNYGQTTLPHFNDTVWTKPPVVTAPAPPYDSYTQQTRGRKVVSTGDSPVPSAPFANAGPPGVQFYPTPLHKSYSIYPSINWSASSTSRSRPN